MLRQNGGRAKELMAANSRWLKFIPEITAEVGRIGLLMHGYLRGLEKEKIEIKEIQNIKVGSMLDETLKKPEYD